MIPFAHNIIHGVVSVAVRKAVEQAEDVMRQKEEVLRQKYWILAGAWDILTTPVRLWQFWKDQEHQATIPILLSYQHPRCHYWGVRMKAAPREHHPLPPTRLA